MNTEIPAELADGIDPEAITIPQVKIQALEEAAQAIKDDGQDVSDFGHDIKTAWGGLEGIYSAPEDQTLFSAIDPVATKGDDVHSAATTVGDALLAFAEDVRPIICATHRPTSTAACSCCSERPLPVVPRPWPAAIAPPP